MRGRGRLCSAFQPGNLPGDPAVGEGALQPVAFQHGQHRRWRVGEGAELASHEAEAEVLGGEDRARDRIFVAGPGG
jgi:hypothetical protein